jgi:hypothetical protein
VFKNSAYLKCTIKYITSFRWGLVFKHLFTIILLAVASISLIYSQAKRSPYAIPLAKLSVCIDENTGRFESVRVVFGNSEDESFYISPQTDTEIKITKDGRRKYLHGELPDKAFIISDFEAEVINKVCKTLIATLDIFEKDLQHERWDKILYLDSFFPKFLKAFYYLYCAARNSPYALPKSICIPDSLYDISLTSPKSEERIKQWQKEPNHILKLRIVSKELIYQIKEWQKKEIDNSNRNKEISYGKKFEEAFTLFMKVYFNLQPIPTVPQEGEHL